MKRARYTYPVSIGMLLILFALLLVGSRHVSITTDEMLHIGFGYTYLARGQDAFWILPFRGQPLLNAIEAFLPYLAKPSLPVEEMAQWGRHYGPYIGDLAYHLFGVEQAQMGWMRFTPPLMRSPLAEPAESILIARIPMIFLTVLLGAIVFRWAKDLWGPMAGLAALFALCFDPTLLAHGRLPTTDVGTVTLGTAALYTTWRWTRRPAWHWALGSGTLLGLTMLAKSSGAMWAAAAGLIVLANALIFHREERARLLIQGIAAGLLSLLLIWGAYGFSIGPVEGFPFPLPASNHWYSILFHAEGATRQQTFAAGLRTTGRLWWYFPFAFLIKNPLPLLLGLIGSAINLLRQPVKYRRLLALGIFPAIYIAVAILWGMNIGYRHMLPIHPFLYLLVGGGAYVILKKGPGGLRWATIILGLWLAAETLAIYPNEIAYFNQLVGGPEKGYRYLSDSNVEWGQSSHLLYAYAEDHPEAIIGPPEHRLLPEAGRYVVNAAQLQGSNISDRYAYEWFRYREPTSRINEGLLIYDVPPPEVDWLAQCTRPDVPLQDEILSAEISVDSLRQVRFDCTAGWLYPEGGKSSGLYALHHELVGPPIFDWSAFTFTFPPPDDAFTARRLAGADLAFEHDVYQDQLPAFLMYEVERDEAPVIPPSAHSPALDGEIEERAASLEHGLTFIGAMAYPGTDIMEVETWWQIDEGPITQPMSIMAHLLGPNGETLGVADGLGVSPLTFRPGDILVQRHVFPAPPNSEGLWLQTGVYWLEGTELWPVRESPGTETIFIPLNGRHP